MLPTKISIAFRSRASLNKFLLKLSVVRSCVYRLIRARKTKFLLKITISHASKQKICSQNCISRADDQKFHLKLSVVRRKHKLLLLITIRRASKSCQYNTLLKVLFVLPSEKENPFKASFHGDDVRCSSSLSPCCSQSTP